jgi:hypothetical protein
MAKPRFAVSNLSAPPKESLGWSATDYRKFASDADGLLWTDYKKPHNWTGRLAVELALSGDILGWHQSWMTTRLRDLRLGNPNDLVQTIALMALMQPLERSLGAIRGAEAAATKVNPQFEHLPIVVHPYGQYLGNKPLRPSINYHSERLGLGELLIQPTVEWVQALGGDSRDPQRTAQNIIEMVHDEGAYGVALDLNHLFAVRAGRRFRDPRAIAVGLAGLYADGGLEQVHFGIQTKLYPDTKYSDMEELQVMLGLDPFNHFLDSTQGMTMTEIAAVLPDAHEYLVVSETTAADVAAAGLHWVEGNRRLIEGARVALGAN